MRRAALALALALVVGAALRFATLDGQSLWYDEAVTAGLLRMDFGAMLQAIPDSESTPPLYYVVAWLWTHVFGTGEVGLRSLSALLGTATIAVVWLLGRRLGGDRGAAAAAALVAVNPMLVWFSQEARAYALLALLGALASLLWLRALERPQRGGRFVAWGAVAALALATHYYAAFLVAPQALWLVLRAPGRRQRAVALAVPLAAAAALAPLALGQRANDTAAFIRDTPFATRLAQVPKQFVLGYNAPLELALALLSALALVGALAGLVLLVREQHDGDRGSGRARRDVLLLAAVLAAALLAPALAAAVGEDHVITRNLLAPLPALAALAGAGIATLSRRAPQLAAGAAAAACAAGAAAVLGTAADPALQRDDWRGAARALGSPGATALVVASPPALVPLRYYLPGLHALRSAQAAADEIAYVALSAGYPHDRLAPPPPAQAPVAVTGFALAGAKRTATFTVVRLRAAAPQPVLRATLATGLDGRPAAVLACCRS